MACLPHFLGLFPQIFRQDSNPGASICHAPLTRLPAGSRKGSFRPALWFSLFFSCPVSFVPGFLSSTPFEKPVGIFFFFCDRFSTIFSFCRRTTLFCEGCFLRAPQVPSLIGRSPSIAQKWRGRLSYLLLLCVSRDPFPSLPFFFIKYRRFFFFFCAILGSPFGALSDYPSVVLDAHLLPQFATFGPSQDRPSVLLFLFAFFA